MVRFVRPGLLRTTSLSRTFSVLLELCRPESSAEKAQASPGVPELGFSGFGFRVEGLDFRVGFGSYGILINGLF